MTVSVDAFIAGIFAFQAAQLAVLAGIFTRIGGFSARLRRVEQHLGFGRGDNKCSTSHS